MKGKRETQNLLERKKVLNEFERSNKYFKEFKNILNMINKYNIIKKGDDYYG